jgi:GDPmannose 4,6-dehydratase
MPRRFTTQFMNALIFGANGQDGFYLTNLCKAKGLDAIGVARSGSCVRGDVSRYDQVEEVIRSHLPDYIFHLAANSSTQHEALFENHETISTGTLNILEAVKNYHPDAKVFITGSGVQFENTGTPISERDPFEANSAYSVARIQSVYAARYYRSLGLAVYVGYLFHHESPLRKPRHVSQKIAQAAQRIAEGSREIIEVGDISVEKEWTFAGDVARGIFTLIEQNDVFEAVIGSGVGYSIKKWLEQCFGIIGQDWAKHVRVREGFAAEYKRLVSNPKTMRSLGWSPTIELPELAAMMISANSTASFLD